MSYWYVVSGELSSSGAAKRWLLAYPAAQAICLAATAGATALASLKQWSAGSGEAVALTVGIATLYGLTFGYLRGFVIRHKLARFSMLHWCTAIAAISLFFLPPAPDAVAALRTSISVDTVTQGLAPVALSGFVYGIAIGAAEAFSLRRAAFGLSAWVVLSGIAWSCGTVIATLVASLQPTTISGSGVIPALLQALIAGIIMLAALRSLMPQLKYYGPRVYRDAVRTRG
jgi:hypothetical protein